LRTKEEANCESIVRHLDHPRSLQRPLRLHPPRGEKRAEMVSEPAILPWVLDANGIVYL
jgi:hypothetical protein